MCYSHRNLKALFIFLLFAKVGVSSSVAGNLKNSDLIKIDTSGIKSVAALDSIYLNLGIFYRKVGNFNSSTQCFYQGLSWSKKMGLDKLKARYLTNIGINKHMLGNLTKSLAFYNQALDIYKSLKDTLREAYLLNNLSLIYRKQKDFDKALNYYNQATEVKLRYGLSGSRLNQNSLAFIYRDLEQYKQALYYHETALNFLIKEERAYYEAQTYNYIGDIFLLMDNYDSAIYKYHQGFRLGQKLDAMETVLSAAKGLANTYKQLKAFDSAYFYLEIAELHKDSASSKNDIKLISEMEAVYDLKSLRDKNDLENAKSELAIQQRNLIISIISFISIILAGIALNVYRNQKQKMKATQTDRDKNDLIHKQTINQLLKEREVKSMKSFIQGQEQERSRIARDLHDGIGGTLASLKIGLQRITLHVDQEKISHLTKGLDRACNEVRSVAQNMAPPKFRSTHFISVLTSFISEMQKSSQIVINADFQCPDELNTLDEKLQIEIYRIMQEVVANVIKHANAKEIDLQLFKIDDLINLTIEDNGKGFDSKRKVSGAGLLNIVSRVELLKGRFNIDSREGRGTIINIDFPINPTLI